MLSEDHTFEAKRFLKHFKDALNCIEQASHKQASSRNYQDFYRVFRQSVGKEQLLLDEDGGVSAGNSVKSSDFYYMNYFVK